MYELTPALLNLYQDCARCFWVEIHEKVKRPLNFSSSTLQGGMNLVFKKYADIYRLKGSLPPELSKQVEGIFLPDADLIKKWRDRKAGLYYENKDIGVSLRGTLDECVVREDEGEQVYVPLDFTTRGYDNKEEAHDNHAQLKLDCYDLLLNKNGYKTSSTGYLVYYIPEEVRESGVVEFNVQVIQLVTEGRRVMNLMTEVADVLNGKIPEAGQNCEYCAWGDLGAKIMRAKV